MNENELAEQFDRDVDQILDSNLKLHDEPTSTEYRQVIDLAQSLSATDFTVSSKIKKLLLNQLLTTHREDVTMLKVPQRMIRLRLTLFILVSILLLLMISPVTLQVAAKKFADFIKTIQVGDYTWIQQSKPSEKSATEATSPIIEPIVEYRDGIWILRTSIGNFGGDPLPDHSITVQSFDSILDAQALAPFSIRQPYFLPTGYDLQEVMVTPSDWVFLFYSSSNGNLVIAQLPVGEVTINEPGEVINSVPVGPVTVGQKNTVGVGMLTDKDVDAVLVNNQPAAWVEGTGLMWESDGISFMAGSANLSKEEIMQIAESVK